MEYRSTNDQGYTHLKGDLVTNVSSGGVQNSSHGVLLTGGSTGGFITAAGDETNIALTVKAKGSGPLILGDSSNAMFLGSTVAQSGAAVLSGPVNSTAIVAVRFKGIFQSSFTVQFAGLSSNVVTDVTLSTAETHAISGDLISITARPSENNGSSNLIALTGWRCSTVGTSNITLQLSNISSTTTSTGRITGLVTYLDLT